MYTASSPQQPLKNSVFLQDKYPFDIRGRSGKPLDDVFAEQGGPTAYLGTTVPDFPNFMLVQGEVYTVPREAIKL